MRDNKKLFDSPVSIGILVIPVYRAIRNIENIEEKKGIVEIFGEMSGKLCDKVDFLARYDAPTEMRLSSGWGQSGEEFRLFPGIIFAAYIRQRQTKT
jgi:hypothetical protein